MTSVHDPRDVRIFQKECKSLVAAGYEVTLIAAGAASAIVEGVRVIGVRAPRGRLDRMLRVVPAVFLAALRLKADLYHFHDPELMPCGVLLKLFGRRVVYDVHEDLSADLLHKPWIAPVLRVPTAFAARTVEAVLSLTFDGIVITRPSLARKFSAKKTRLVHNYPILGELLPTSDTPYRDRPEVAAYVGGGTRERGMRELVGAFGTLPPHSRLRLVIAGRITPEPFLEELRQLPGWKRVDYLGWQNRTQVADLLSNARFGIVMFLPIGNHITSEPTKLFEYMSAKLPIVASNIPHWRKVVEDGGFGRVVDPQSPEQIVAAMQGLLDDPVSAERMGANGFAAVRSRYNWDTAARNLLGLYDRILS